MKEQSERRQKETDRQDEDRKKVFCDLMGPNVIS